MVKGARQVLIDYDETGDPPLKAVLRLLHLTDGFLAAKTFDARLYDLSVFCAFKQVLLFQINLSFKF